MPFYGRIQNQLKMNQQENSGSYISSGMQWVRRHPILFNIFLIMLTACALVWIGLTCLDSWTGHGQFEVVPDVRGLQYNRASEILRSGNLVAELSDSIYDDHVAPGTVVDQMPKMNDKVKPQRTVYLTINAFSPKSVTLPDSTASLYGRHNPFFEGYGFKNVRINYVPSEYKDLVLGAKFNGINLKGGTRVPISASITLEVGEGYAAAEDSDIIDNNNLNIDDLTAPIPE